MREIQPKEISGTPFEMIGEQWMLITAGNKEKFNTMTASWGGMGVIWNKDVCFIFVRPQRYTYEFLERESTFTLSFLPEKYRSALSLCGSKSGRDTDKVKEANLTPVFDENGIYFDEAELVIVCKKLYFQDLTPDGVKVAYVLGNYTSRNDYHRMYIGEITKVLTK